MTQNAAHDGRIPRGASSAISFGRGAGSHSQAVASSRQLTAEGAGAACEAPLLPETPGASAPGFFLADYLAVLRLALLTDIHKAERRHQSTKELRRQLVYVTAELAAAR